MKTTIDIAEPILREARKLAARKGITLCCLVEEGLRRVLAEERRKTPFRLRQAAFGGRGLRPELRGKTWDEIREMSYERGKE
jgi:hypothetical protein